MCRAYGARGKTGGYIRLCYRHGYRKGWRVPVAADDDRLLGMRSTCVTALEAMRARPTPPDRRR